MEVDAIIRELTESGELIGGEALAYPSTTRTVRVRGGVPAITDGPFAEAKERTGGYLMVECESPERAAEIAARWPGGGSRSGSAGSGRAPERVRVEAVGCLQVGTVCGLDGWD